jgi:hypothetical protein
LFSFFGAFTELSPGLAGKFRQRWPDASIIEISKPFLGQAIRFQESQYDAGSEDLPESVSAGMREISQLTPGVRIVLLRTECWGGICRNWGQFILDGRVVVNELAVEPPEGRGVLRRLIRYLNVDIGPSEIFEPLSRSFTWTSGE